MITRFTCLGTGKIFFIFYFWTREDLWLATVRVPTLRNKNRTEQFQFKCQPMMHRVLSVNDTFQLRRARKTGVCASALGGYLITQRARHLTEEHMPPLELSNGGEDAFSSNLSRSLKDFLVDASLILHRVEHLLNAHYWAGCGRQGRGRWRTAAARVQNVKPRAQKVIVMCCKHRLCIRVRAHFISQQQHRKPGFFESLSFEDLFFCDALLVNRYFTSSWSPSRTFWDRDPFGEGCWRQES